MNYYNYFTEIEETFVRRRGKHLFLSPLDWALIDVWRERGIPLHIVIRSIESVFDVFDKQPPGTRTIKSLFYCREEIESQYAEWLRSQTGAASPAADDSSLFDPADIAAFIDSSIAALDGNQNEFLTEAVPRAIERLKELRSNLTNDLETVDKTLGDIEKIIDRALLSGWEPERFKQFEKETAESLKQYRSQMDKDAYRTTYDLMLLKRLREEAGIPRLGLFYL